MPFRPASLCLLLLVATASGAAAGEPLDDLRSATRSSRERLDALTAQQLGLRSELSGLSERIEVLKAKAKGRLLRNAELDVALKRSQELSSQLTRLAQAVPAEKAELDSASAALAAALTEALGHLRDEFDRAVDRPARRSLLEQMKALEVERAALRASLPPGPSPAKAPQALAATDDPEALLEQLELVRDAQEKLSRQLKVLDARVTERRQEAELDRRVSRFLDEESAFDDRDRRLRVERITASTAATSGPGNGASSAPGSSTDVAPGSSYAGPLAAAAGGADTPPPRSNSPEPTVLGGSDARPQLGEAPRVDLEAGDLATLERERQRLLALDVELANQAKALERRAAEAR